MAKLETALHENIHDLANRIEKGILEGSFSATLEESSNFRVGDAECRVLVFERYSYSGGNRLSMNVTLFQKGDSPTYVSAITAGGSQAMLFKWNTMGENAFLEKLKEIL